MKPTRHGNVFEAARQQRDLTTRVSELAAASKADNVNERLTAVARTLDDATRELHSIAEGMPGGADADDAG